MGVHSEIFRIDVATGAAKALTDGPHAVLSWSIVPSANRMVFQLDEPTRLGDAWTLPIDGGTPTRVTGIYDTLTRDFALPRQEKVSWKGADGVTIEGVLFYPIDYQQGRRYPLVVQLHGGPPLSDKFGYGPGVIFNYVPVLTGRGYAVFRPNYRGSAGYGTAFIRDIVGHYFNNMHLDVMAGVDALVKQGHRRSGSARRDRLERGRASRQQADHVHGPLQGRVLRGRRGELDFDDGANRRAHAPHLRGSAARRGRRTRRSSSSGTTRRSRTSRTSRRRRSSSPAKRTAACRWPRRWKCIEDSRQMVCRQSS